MKNAKKIIIALVIVFVLFSGQYVYAGTCYIGSGSSVTALNQTFSLTGSTVNGQPEWVNSSNSYWIYLRNFSGQDTIVIRDDQAYSDPNDGGRVDFALFQNNTSDLSVITWGGTTGVVFAACPTGGGGTTGTTTVATTTPMFLLFTSVGLYLIWLFSLLVVLFIVFALVGYPIRILAKNMRRLIKRA